VIRQPTEPPSELRSEDEWVGWHQSDCAGSATCGGTVICVKCKRRVGFCLVDYEDDRCDDCMPPLTPTQVRLRAARFILIIYGIPIFPGAVMMLFAPTARLWWFGAGWLAGYVWQVVLGLVLSRARVMDVHVHDTFNEPPADDDDDEDDAS
jgi:hypothetical protein